MRKFFECICKLSTEKYTVIKKHTLLKKIINGVNLCTTQGIPNDPSTSE